MSVNEYEVLTRTCRQVEKSTQELRNAMNNLGSKNDAVARQKISRVRKFVEKAITKADQIINNNSTNANNNKTNAINNTNSEVYRLRERYLQLKSSYERISSEVRRKERNTEVVTTDNNSFVNESLTDVIGVSKGKEHNNIYFQKNKKYCWSSNNNNNNNNNNEGKNEEEDEEANVADESEALLQQVEQENSRANKYMREKEVREQRLENIREIEEDVIDLKTTYEEFHSLVHQQQSGLDTIQSNVNNTQTLVDGGTEQLQAASDHQKRSKKISCLIAVMLICIMATVAVLVFALTIKKK